MRRMMSGLLVLVGLLVVSAHAASAQTASAQVCVTIDESRDTFAPADRAAALVLVTRQFEAEGQRVVSASCPSAFTLYHVRLLDTIVVTMTGPGGTRELVARGSADLLAVYSQLIRSLLTGRPMNGLGVTDRTNVTETQAAGLRVHSDSVWYAKVGYGVIQGDTSYRTPSFGFGFRAELDRYAIDVSFLNFQMGDANRDGGAHAQSIVKLSGLYFLRPQANESAYVGGGLGYGYQRFGRNNFDNFTGSYDSDFDGNGLEGGLTVGYAIARATSLRVFVQADVILPFYTAESESFSVSRPGGIPNPQTTFRSRYAPAYVISVGVGR